MKKFIYTTLLAVITVGLSTVFTSCSSDDEYPISDKQNDISATIPEEVSFNLDYSFVESGNMTRSAGSDAYNSFYEKYIKSKVLTPRTYDLTFKSSTGVYAYFKGTWGDKNIIRLTEGEWTVTGTSYPSKYCIDTLKLSFNEKVNITKDMSKLTLKAQNVSYLLLFNKNYVQTAIYETTNSYPTFRFDLQEKDALLYMFSSKNYSEIITATNKNGNTEKISFSTNTCPFEIGKYYYFENIDGGFDVPKMDEGL